MNLLYVVSQSFDNFGRPDIAKNHSSSALEGCHHFEHSVLQCLGVHLLIMMEWHV